VPHQMKEKGFSLSFFTDLQIHENGVMDMSVKKSRSMKNFYVIFFLLYLLYAAGMGTYLFSLTPGAVPQDYKGTTADPYTFLTAKQIEESHQLDLISYFTFFLQTPLDFILLVAVLSLSKRVRDHAKKIAKRSFWQFSYYYLVISFVLTAIYLPLDIFFYRLRHHYDLTDQSVLSWTKDFLIDLGLDFVIFTPLLYGAFWLIRKQPKKWWISMWGLLLPLALLRMFLFPQFINPLFNDYKPLEDEKVHAEIEQLAEAAGIPDAKISEMNMSKQTNQMNAFVTGIGSNMQIVLGDTTLEKLTVDEIRFIMAHEIGHYTLKHIYHGLFLSVFITFFITFGTYHVYHFLLINVGSQIGIKEAHDFSALPLFLLAFAIVSFPISPIEHAHSRYMEFEADQYALNMTKNKEAAISSFQKLTEDSKTIGYEPDLIHYFLGSHPRLTERIDYVEHYRISKKK
jgi:STE24 endopeptidase